MIHYNKLIRDKIPEIKAREKKGIVYHTAITDQEYWFKLREKLQEELREFDERGDIESLADLFEVLEAMSKFKKLDIEEVWAVKKNKKIEQGGFKKRIVLDQSDEEIGHRQYESI
jgi:predicted house-cleaning noncanonical NTP pyrophosphatase (MazG superfamily)